MIDFNELYFFAQVVQRGSFTKAARAIGIPKSRLSRRVAELETRLGVRLLQRTTRRLSLTDIGSKYYEQCQAMLAAAHAAEQTVENLSSEPRGQLRVTVPLGVAQDIAVHLGKFLRAYPRIRMELVVTNRRIDLVEEGVDVALRVRPRAEEDPNLVTRHLHVSRALVVASPAFLERYPGLERPDDLRDLPALGFGTRTSTVHWAQVGPGGELSTVEIAPQFFSDDFFVLKYLALDGLGAALMPEVNCKQELAQGTLVPVLPGWQSDTGILHAVYPTTRGLSPVVRAFIDFLVATLAKA